MSSSVKVTLTITDAQERFLRQKVKELRRHVQRKDEMKVTTSSVVSGLLEFWMTLDAAQHEKQKIPHKDTTPETE